MTALMLRLYDGVDDLVEQIYIEKGKAEKYRNYEYTASVKIQSWYRGARSRFYLKFLNNAATTIQRHWKGHSARVYYEKASWDIFKKTCEDYYMAMATVIQKTWKGYWSRKKIFDFYKRKRYLENVCKKNEIVMAKLNRFAKEVKEIEEIIAHEKEEMKREQKVFRHPPPPPPPPTVDKDTESIIRLRLGQSELKFHSFNDRGRGNLHISTDETGHIVTERILPPLPQKPQGPFRDPKIVRLQRYKQLKPTLRVESSFDSLDRAKQQWKQEEWVKRLHDNHFLPCKGLHPKYQPLLNTRTEYGPIPYGTRYFRESNQKLFISDKDFATTVSSSIMA